ncbi:MAG: amino acid ABC transporter permease [Chloroflexota bacterium]
MRLEVINQNLPALLAALGVTIQIAIGATVLGVLLGLITAVCRMSPIRLLSKAAVVYIELIRNTPALVQLFILYYGFGQLGFRIPALTAMVVALGINNGAYLAEIFRGGLQSVRRGQLEAAAALALPSRTTFLGVVLPQAIRSIWPALTNQTIQIVLATSLAAIVGMPDLVNKAMYFISRTYRTNEFLLAVTVMYWILTLAVSFASRIVARWLERAYR